ncbi:GPW/gp25 family protein [Echinicola jeungdonensis]|uniref:GPW/gp25 family protein n=1 Tax=Echinicola jeungdonensis TaxID=709343 RepID=A0ABV5J8D9_9BACT|nr:GPW/gp25 family protein [Echinicola jeungdonensis]MDN3670817.1 GPW/gp25 family protein [Echinicola jeungdonensis]
MEDEKKFLGTGWSFPPEFDQNRGKLQTTSGVVDIEKSLQVLLSTKLGERVMHPTYGCNLEELLFSPINRTLKTYVSELIKTAILYHEPRIDAEKIDISQGNELKGELLINIQYKIRATNSRHNLVFPFYKEEGTNI